MFVDTVSLSYIRIRGVRCQMTFEYCQYVPCEDTEIPFEFVSHPYHWVNVTLVSHEPCVLG